MPGGDSSTRSPRTLSFAFDGVSAREQTVFKSFVRLVDHRTDQHWRHRQGRAHLVVAAPGSASVIPSAGQVVLTLGPSGAGHMHHLSFPIHASELEATLNTLGAMLVARRAQRRHVSGAIAVDDAVRLARWPPASLLPTRSHLRLATLLTGRPLTPAELQRLSGTGAQTCMAFLAALDRAGLLLHQSIPGNGRPPVAQAHATIAAETTSMRTGLFARIRKRLGLGSRTHP